MLNEVMNNLSWICLFQAVKLPGCMGMAVTNGVQQIAKTMSAIYRREGVFIVNQDGQGQLVTQVWPILQIICTLLLTNVLWHIWGKTLEWEEIQKQNNKQTNKINSYRKFFSCTKKRVLTSNFTNFMIPFQIWLMIALQYASNIRPWFMFVPIAIIVNGRISNLKIFLK